MKKKIAFITALIMVFSASAVSLGASYSDMPSTDSKNYSAMEYAIAKGILTGDGSLLMLDSTLTRAQAAAFLSRALSLSEAEKDLKFTDVKTTDWYYASVALCVKAGLFQNGEKFNPNDVLTQKEALTLLGKAYKFSETDPAKLYTVFTGSSAPASLTQSTKRGDFIYWLYGAVKSAPTQTATESATTAQAQTEAESETATEATTEAQKSEYQLAAEAAMRLALGLREDGSSYLKEAETAYRDGGQNRTWIYTGSSSSGGSSSKATESSTEPETEAQTEKATEKVTEAPTEQESYTGTIDNNKDNIVDDPFGSDDDDDEDDTFNFDDNDPTDASASTEAETESEKEPESETEIDSSAEPGSETESESESESGSESASETEAGSETESEFASELTSETTSETEIESESESESLPEEETTSEEEEAPSEPAGEPQDDEEDESPTSVGLNLFAIFKKNRWFA